jgi:hypothetical protein
MIAEQWLQAAAVEDLTLHSRPHIYDLQSARVSSIVLSTLLLMRKTAVFFIFF